VMSVKIQEKPNQKSLQPKESLRTIRYGKEVFSFERLDRKSDKPKIRITVHRDCRVTVHAPDDVDEEEVLNAVKKRTRWIYKRIHEFKAQREFITPRKYISGESHYYLGKQYMLKVEMASESQQCVKLLRGKFEVGVHQNSPEQVKAVLNQWYTSRAKYIFEKQLTELLKQTLWVAHRPVIKILPMKTQWGNCSNKGNLTLNPALVKAPRECIDYVILHELCHIAEHNHSKRFYLLLSQVMPNWKSVKEKLDAMADYLIHVD